MKNNRESLLREIQQACFVAHECALYLDCHPDCRKALEKRSAALKKEKDATQRYESLYGPLTINSAGGNGWNWTSGPWPWQREEK